MSKKKIDTVFVRYITDVLGPSSSDIKDVIGMIDDRYKEQIQEIEESVYLTGEQKRARINDVKKDWNKESARFPDTSAGSITGWSVTGILNRAAMARQHYTCF